MAAPVGLRRSPIPPRHRAAARLLKELPDRDRLLVESFEALILQQQPEIALPPAGNAAVAVLPHVRAGGGRAAAGGGHVREPGRWDELILVGETHANPRRRRRRPSARPAGLAGWRRRSAARGRVRARGGARAAGGVAVADPRRAGVPERRTALGRISPWRRGGGWRGSRSARAVAESARTRTSPT